jgi:DTW domain-containing protein YfiP
MMRHEHCVCSDIPQIDIEVDILVVRHWKERHKPSNTARLAALAIPKLSIVDYGGPGEHWDPEILNVPSPALLFPSENISPLPYSPKTIVVVDGSWPQARKLVNKLPHLSTMPRIQVAPLSIAPTRLRQPPIPEGLCTIEAIARLLDQLHGLGTGQPLDALYARVVEATVAARGRPLR